MVLAMPSIAAVRCRRRLGGRILWVLSLVLLVVGGGAHAQRKLKVYISADLEGVGGVATGADASTEGKNASYGQSQKWMTQEVNAAVAGAFDAGATEVVVGDSHWEGRNLDLELLDKRAHLVRGLVRPLSMMQGIDGSFDAVVFIGYHASEGQPAAVMSHTMSGGLIFDLKINGTSVPEAGFNAAIAGEFGVPVVFLSGDQTIGEEARRLLGAIETVAVKQAVGFYSATMMHPSEAQRLIRAGVKRAVEQRGQFKPYRLTHPIKMEVTFKRPLTAEVASYIPGAERPRGNVVVFTVKDMLEAARLLVVVSNLNPS
jgi:D-amino peptidase